MQTSLAHRLLRRPGHFARHARPQLTGPFLGALFSVAAVTMLLAGFAAAAVDRFLDPYQVGQLTSEPLALTTHIYDRSGTHLLYSIAEEPRELVPLAAVPLRMQQATIAIEDRSFWTNPGIDVGGIIRAFNANRAAGGISQGGSTITQQLIKSRLLGDEPTFERKFKEAILAIEAQRVYTKPEILEMYLNQIYYGRQAYGIRVAARTLFGASDLNQLTLGQMALLAGLPQAPSAYDPGLNPEGARARRGAVLNAMVEMGYITAAEATTAAAEPIAVREIETPLFAPHFVFRAREQLVREFGEEMVARGGLKVITSIDWNMQELAEKEVRDHVDGLKSSNVHNASLITMDPTTGEVIAYVGSYDYRKNTPQMRGDYDHAGIADRQPGSTFKLFTYLAAMQKLKMSPASTVYDVAFEVPDGNSTYKPQNAPDAQGQWQQRGPTTMRQALRESLNLPALWTTRLVGVDAIIDTVHQLGINRQFDRSRLGLSFGIGAAEMRLIDMASAYQVVANGGVRVEPTMILSVADANGKLLRDYTKVQGKRVLDAQTAYLMTDILKDNTNPQGSFVFGPWTTIGRPAALKTGTTDKLQDVLAIGYTPTRLTAIWMGNSDNSEMRGISSALGPGVLWRDYMKSVVGGLPPDDFVRPEGIVEKVVCVNPSLYGGNGSGKIPGPYCPSGFRRTEKFAAGNEPGNDDFYTSCGIRLISPVPEWQVWMNRWASAAVAGARSYGRFTWTICGFAAPSPSPSGSPGPSSSPTVTPKPTPTPKPRGR